MKKRFKTFIFITVIITGLVIGVHSLIHEINVAKNPRSIEPALAELISFDQNDSGNIRGRECLSDDVTDVRLLGRYEDSVALYQLWEYTGENGYKMSGTLLFGEVCGTTYDPVYGDEITDRIPLEGARSLTVQLLEQKIEEAGGIENFEADLAATLSEIEGGKPELTSVYVWALHENGVEISEDLYTVRDIDDRAPR